MGGITSIFYRNVLHYEDELFLCGYSNFSKIVYLRNVNYNEDMLHKANTRERSDVMNFKKLIESKGLTMYKLAKQAQIGQSTVNQLANKKRLSANMNTLTSIASVLKVSVDVVCTSLREE